MVYLLHFDRPYRHARHYVGFVDGGRAALAGRIDRHRRGDGARLLEVVTAAGIGFTVARTWPGEGRAFERRLKDRHGAGRFCPCCRRRRRPPRRADVAPATTTTTTTTNATPETPR